jgi:NAD(P)-dependent dehydrogenase (short-subunit alcohol dehydrogenase family)
MDLGLKGKTVLVTGGGAGLGAGICEVFAQEGANIIVNYIVDEAGVLKFVESLGERFSGSHTAMYGDITKEEDIDNMIKQAVAKYGHLDVVVNNAGIWPTTLIENMSDAEWRKVIDVNLTGPFMISKRACVYYKNAGIRGRIVNITSKSAYAVNTEAHAHYVSAKGGLVLLTKALAREFSQYGIIVNGAIPGMVRTPLNEDKLSKPEVLAAYVERIPSGRISTAQEVGYTVAFLASSKADFINGTCVDVTGGMLI